MDGELGEDKGVKSCGDEAGVLVFIYACSSLESVTNAPETLTFLATLLSCLGSAVTGEALKLEHHQRH